MDGNSKSAIAPVVTELSPVIAQITADVPPNYSVQIDSIIIANIAPAAETFDLYIHAAGVLPVSANAIALGVSIAANTIYIINGPFILPAGWRISGGAGGAKSINAAVCGYIINETVY